MASTTTFGSTSDPYCAELIVDERTGEMFLVYAPSLNDLDDLCDLVLEAA